MRQARAGKHAAERERGKRAHAQQDGSCSYLYRDAA
jgi:hypothetical protein